MNSVDHEKFESYRPLMFSIAYRMLGSVTEAEDIVQEAYLRYQAAPVEQISSPKAFLSTVVTRLCLNHLELAQVQRESYIGPWLPEPALIKQDERFLPAQRAELHESLSMAFLVLLEQGCEESVELPAADVAARQAVNYVDESPQAGKTCANCRFFKQRAAGAACGGCEIVKGPIAAEGYCNAWVA